MSKPTLLIPGKLNATKYMSAETRTQLSTLIPLDYIVDFIGERMSLHGTAPHIIPGTLGEKIIVIKAGTGSGKSTLIIPELYRKFYEKTKRNYCCTQPSVINAVSIPYSIAQYYPELVIGKTLGYSTGPQNRRIRSGAIFMTVGVLLQQLKTLPDEQFIRKYAVIAVDEVHMRSVETDTTLFYLKRFLERNWQRVECPVVIFMSATFDESIFMDFYKVPSRHYLEVTGSTYPIEKVFTAHDPANWINWVVDMVELQHITRISEVRSGLQFRDFLVFVSTNAQIERIARQLRAFNSKVLTGDWSAVESHAVQKRQFLARNTSGAGVRGGADTNVNNADPRKSPFIHVIELSRDSYDEGAEDYRALYSRWETLSTPVYKIVDGKLSSEVIRHVVPGRRVIVSTNMAEVGVTIDTLGCVFDPGLHFNVEFNPVYGARCMFEKNITKASATQRRGRVGRLAPGTCYHGYSEATHDMFQQYNPPNILTEETAVGLLPILIDEVGTEIVREQHEGFQFQKNMYDQNWYTLVHKSKFAASKLDFIQYPSADGISHGLRKLHALGFIDDYYRATLYGVLANKFRMIPPECTRMILAGYFHGANILDLITLASIVNMSHKLGRPRKPPALNPLRLTPERAELYKRFVFMDDLLEYLWLYADFMEVFDGVAVAIRKKKPTKLSVVADWCKTTGVSLLYMLKWVEARDDLIESMLNAGLNPFYNGLGLRRGTYNLVSMLRGNLNEGLEEVKKIKLCIADGYAFNRLRWNAKLSQYCVNGTPVVVESSVVEPVSEGVKVPGRRPHHLVTTEIKLFNSNSSPGMFEFRAGEVSVLDGFVV
jgi:HrpA-like RNA helicase